MSGYIIGTAHVRECNHSALSESLVQCATILKLASLKTLASYKTTCLTYQGIFSKLKHLSVCCIYYNNEVSDKLACSISQGLKLQIKRMTKEDDVAWQPDKSLFLVEV